MMISPDGEEALYRAKSITRPTATNSRRRLSVSGRRPSSEDAICMFPRSAVVGDERVLVYDPLADLAAKRRPSAIHFGLRNQTCAHQISNARIGQTVTMPAHSSRDGEV
jgi:hypothetical protein